jgi:hypothetical protein
MQDSLSGRAAELAHLTDLIRTSLSLADAAIPLINRRRIRDAVRRLAP